MKEKGFYKIRDSYIDLISKLHGCYGDRKERPVYCCIADQSVEGLYWAIPTSLQQHRTPQQMERIRALCALPKSDIRFNWYALGYTNKPAIFKISNALPITEKYIEGEYLSNGRLLLLQDKAKIAEIEGKLRRILSDEHRHPNKYEQHITTLFEYLENELQQEKTLTGSLDIAEVCRGAKEKAANTNSRLTCSLEEKSREHE